MLEKIIKFSIQNKLIVLLFSAGIIGAGIYSLLNLPIGAVPDITNNQVQVITTSKNLATQDIEKFITAPIELEMANLPNVTEIRSVSKFGLSVVTIIFDDEIGTYLPRQLIAEKIKSAEEKIPKGFGTPFMGPITTGLGEIYQYTLEVDAEHKHLYSLTDLRTIQDWVVKRQLSGLKGVVEVNTWGGNLKQYEVAIDPEKLRAMGISLSEVFSVLEKNNSIAGGGYIERANESYFIRGEGLVNSLESIENMVVTLRDGVPVYVKNIANVGFGVANRFGAITGNGEGEKVMGQIMMLKDANSKQVIADVHQRIEEVEKLLPPGISINGFLERGELVGKTTFTVAENLILGCLIVIFVVVLLLGNFRSGLVVASVIPMCLFFALTLMYIFGVDANLMSLGAIDFGIIIDGAVIIVEFIAYKITSERLALNAASKEEKVKLTDHITFLGTTKMMRSAVFGQIIIIIVFIPILSLVGVEGKMFRPMALVFCFALIGAMIMCFTYVPVMASLFLKPTDPSKRTISTRIIYSIQRVFEPAIIWALRKKKWVLSGAGLLLLLTVFLFSRMGGEFVPTLDEGDMVIQPVLKTGTSLSKTIETTTQIEKILKTFPEVVQVVTRIGAAEVPTDPMSMEESDVIIKLKPQSEWITASTKDELADKFKAALSDIAGIDYEFTQPIEMRFNELITGVRADIAVKIFGEDLDVLYEKAKEVEKFIQNVDGAADIIVEKVAGLPQMSVKYNDAKIAKYGLNTSDLNDIVTMGFAGKTAGNVFEGEKQFDLVVRFDQEHRKEIEHLRTTSILLPDGTSVPFYELAEISYSKGPAKISRDDTKRRIVIGINVRNRDLESVVKDIQKIIQAKVELPTGYSVEYGGQFENLNSAKARLKIAVPIALILIFLMLYFAFKSVKEALMIFTAIPLSAVGGVLFLYLRDLPFSISAGVGFIALFGIAVLNGIVLIEHFKELKEHGMTNINKRIIMGTQQRLRPVLLTAAAAALGFLPMAISTNAGAEIQRPLATVVIGGLITATLLTLIVLPVLYALFDSKSKRLKVSKNSMLLLVFGVVSISGFSQNKTLSLQEIVQLALENNSSIKAQNYSLQATRELEKTAFSIDKTDVYFNHDQNNIAPNNLALNVWGINQRIQFPTIYGASKQVLQTNTELAHTSLEIQKLNLVKNVHQAYYTVVYWSKMVENAHFLDSIYRDFSRIAELKFSSGETTNLEKLTAITKQKEIEIQLKISTSNLEVATFHLRKLIQTDEQFEIDLDGDFLAQLSLIDTSNHLGVQYMDQAVQQSQHQLLLTKQQLLPDLTIGLFQGSNAGNAPNRYYGIQGGVSIPLFFGADVARIRAAKLDVLSKQSEAENYSTHLQATYNALISEVNSFKEGIDYYESTGKNLYSETMNSAVKAYQMGEIDFLQYISMIENSNQIKINYLQQIYLYNSSVLNANYLTNVYEK